MTELQISLPDDLAQSALAEGLLAPEALEQLLRERLTIMGRAEPPRMMKRRLAPDRSLTPTLSQRARERTCCANFIVRELRLARLDAARERLAETPPAPMTAEEIQAEIDAYRAEQRRAAGA